MQEIRNPYYSDYPYRWGIVLAIACVLTLFLFLGDTLFNTRGEPREAVVALSMIQDGNWILPINNGVDMAYKPPFFHWLVAIVSSLSGEVTEYTSRVPSALALTAMVMAGYVFYVRRSGVEVAFLMGLLTLSNFEVHRAGVACRVDMLLAAMMVMALYQLYRWVQHGMRGLPAGAILALSAALLTKGPVGAALPCVVVLVYGWIREKGFWRTFTKMFLVGLLSCVIPLVWYYLAWLQGGQRFLDLVYEENVLRLLGKMTYESHINPWYYNVMTVAAGFVPYTLLVFMSLFVLKYRMPKISMDTWWVRLKKYVRTVDDVKLFSFLSIAIIFVFYCIPKSKRSVYLLPIYPFLAYFLAEYMIWLRNHHRRVLKAFGWILVLAAVLLPVAFVAVRMGRVSENLLVANMVANMAMLAALRDTPLDAVEQIAFILPVLAAGIFVGMRKHGCNLVQGIALTVFAIFLSLDGLYQPLVLNTKSDKPQAEFIKDHVPEGRVYSYRAHVNPGNPMHPFTINFYLGDRVVPFADFMPAEGYLIVSGDDIASFRQRFRQYEVEEVIDFGHRSCDDRRMIRFYHFTKRLMP